MGLIDSRDLLNSLRRICYEDRARVYDSTIHELEVNTKFDALQELLNSVATSGFPTTIDRDRASNIVGPDTLQWLIDHSVLSIRSDDDYGLVDEFLRLRLIFDEAESPADQVQWEKQMIRGRIPADALDLLESEEDESEEE